MRHAILAEIPCCPACHGDLMWNMMQRSATRIVNATAGCNRRGSDYFVRDEMAVFLTPDLPREDLWQEVGNHMSHVLADNPELDRQLMGAPLDSLSPADLLLRAFERGDLAT